MNGTEVHYRDGLEFRIEQQRLTDRYPTWRMATNPLLWWTTVKDADGFGDEQFHSVNGGARTKKEAVATIDDYLIEKAFEARLKGYLQGRRARDEEDRGEDWHDRRGRMDAYRTEPLNLDDVPF